MFQACNISGVAELRYEHSDLQSWTFRLSQSSKYPALQIHTLIQQRPIPYCEQDLEIRRELGDSVKEVLILSNLSQLYSMIGNEAKAKLLRQEARVALSKIDPDSPEAEEVKQTAKRLQGYLD